MVLPDNKGSAENFTCAANAVTRDFEKSIGAQQSDLALDYSELLLDGILNEATDGFEDLIEGIPIAKTALGLHNAYRGFSTLHFAKKLIVFVQEVSKQAASKKDIDWFRKKFSDGDKNKDKHVEYLLTLIDRYVGNDKPQMLAKLFIAFLDGYISWDELTCYAEILEKLLPGDFSVLSASSVYSQGVADTPAAVLRLVGLGLMVETNRPSAFLPRENGSVGITWNSLSSTQKNEIEYSRTAFGSKLIDAVHGDYSAK